MKAMANIDDIYDKRSDWHAPGLGDVHGVAFEFVTEKHFIERPEQVVLALMSKNFHPPPSQAKDLLASS